MKTTELPDRAVGSDHTRPLSDLSSEGVEEISGSLRELLADNQELSKYLRATHEVCDQHMDVATASLIENWIDETERRSWFLYEMVKPTDNYLREFGPGPISSVSSILA